MKLNLGCGHNRMDGHVNVDASPHCSPDEVFDLETTPWPWPTDSAQEVVFHHSLEHMGADPKVFLAIMQELYRVCAPGAVVRIRVPHPRHDHFLNDPTHVRAITPDVMALFDRELNDKWRAASVANTPLAHYTGVDFEMTKAETVLSEPYASQAQAGKITQDQVAFALRAQNNVAQEYRIELVARKQRD